MNFLASGNLPVYAWLPLIILCLAAGVAAGYVLRLKLHEKSFIKSKPLWNKEKHLKVRFN